MRRCVGVEVEDTIDDCVEVLKAVVKRVIEREWEKLRSGGLVKVGSKELLLRIVERDLKKYGKMLKIEKFVRTKNEKFVKLEQGITKLIYVIASVAKESEIETVIRALQEIADATDREPLPLACLKGLKLHLKIHRTYLSKEKVKIVYRAKSMPAFRTVIIKREGLKMKVWKGMSLRTNGGYVELNELQYAKLTNGEEVVHKVEEEVHLPHWRFALDVPVDPAIGGIEERATDPHEYNWVITKVDEDGRVFISSPTLVRFDLEDFEAS